MSSSTGRNQRRPLSLVGRLQLAIVLAVVGVLVVHAAVLDAALERAFRTEDAAAMRKQLDLVRDAWRARVSGGTVGSLRPGSIRWQIIGENGGIELASDGAAPLPDLDWPAPPGGRAMVRGPGGRRWSVLVATVASRGRRGLVRMAMDRSHEQEALAGYRRVLWGGLAILAALVIVIARLVARHGLAPLRRIAAEVGDIRPGRLHVALEPERFPAELGELVAALDGSLRRLDDAFARLMRLSSDLAHELRTPVANLRADIEAVILRAELPPPLADRIGGLLEEVDRLAAMIEQLLFLARAEDPSRALDPRPLRARAELEAVADFFEAAAAEAGVTLRTEAAEGTLVVADRELLRRVLVNLLANALRHTPRGGEITLAATAEQEATELRVSDTGSGFAPEVLGRIGERFVRGDPARGRQTGGAGLGLAIASRILARHGGELRASNRGDGGGAVVRTVWPRVGS